MTKPSYRTIAEPCEGVYKEKGSKFLAFAFPVADEADIKEHLNRLKKKYHDARHHCYAYILKDESAYRVNDNGEPSGTAGLPIYGQLRSKNLSYVLIVVVRYFGGKKLGVGGLRQAYKTAAAAALENAIVIEKEFS